MSFLKFKIRRLGSLLTLLLVIPYPAFASDAIEYCTDLSYFGDYGAMSFAVTTDDDADTAVVEIIAGYAKGWRFDGSWDGESGVGSGSVMMTEDSLVGTIGFGFDIVSAGAATEITGTVETEDGSRATLFTGIEGACTAAEAPLEGDYCLKVGDENISMNVVRETSGTGRIVGNLASPTGILRPFNAMRDSATGLILEKTTGAEQFKLEFSAGIITGEFTYRGRSFDAYGIRNPAPTATGCRGIMIYSGGTGDFYYATPTIVGHHAYVGTGGGTSHPLATDNYFAKVDLRNMREVWRYDLGTAEVRGSAVLDRKGSVYFVVEEGRDFSFVDGFPEGGHSVSVLKLVRISNPARGAPELEWEYEITAEGESHHMGHLTPAITSRGHVYVGGDALHAVGFDGEELWTFSPEGAGDLQIYNAPIIQEATEKLVYFNVNDAGADYSADGIYAVNLISGKELWSYTPDYIAPSTEYSEDDPAPETYSSPQFNLDRTKIYTALRDQIYCFDLSGDACTPDWEDGCEIPDLSGAIRAAPVVDAAGDIYVGTKDNEDSKLYKVDGTCPASPVIWEADTNADVYTTGVILDTGIIVIGTEPDFDAGILKAYSTTATTGTLEGFFDLDADMTWGSLRMHKGRLIGVANVATSILGGFMFSIDTAGARYERGAQNPTFRGNNLSTGR